jgi:hypothetical protein
MGGVESVSRGEAGADEKLAGAVDDQLVGDGKFEVEAVNGLPHTGEAGFHGFGDLGGVPPVGGEGIGVSVVAEPSEDHPIEEFVEDEAADDGGVVAELGQKAPSPFGDAWIGRPPGLTKVNVEVVGV